MSVRLRQWKRGFLWLVLLLASLFAFRHLVDASNKRSPVLEQQQQAAELDVHRVSFGIKSSGCRICLLRLVQSIRTAYPDELIVVVDDSGLLVTPEVQTSMGFRFVSIPQDSGLSAGRNRLLDEVTSPLMLLLDEDFYFTPETRVQELVARLTQNSFDILAGSVEDRPALCSRFVINREVLYIVDANHGETPDGCSVCDFVPNFFLARVDKLRSLRWADELLIGEHEDFFLRARSAGLRVGMYPAVVVGHDQAQRRLDTAVPTDYDNRRARSEAFVLQGLAKHGFKGLVWSMNSKLRVLGQVDALEAEHFINSYRKPLQLTVDESFFPPHKGLKMAQCVFTPEQLQRNKHYNWMLDVTQWTSDDLPEVEVYLNDNKFKTARGVQLDIYRTYTGVMSEYSLLRRQQGLPEGRILNWKRADILHETAFGKDYLLTVVVENLQTKARDLASIRVFRPSLPRPTAWTVTIPPSNDNIQVYFALSVTVDHPRLAQFLEGLTHVQNARLIAATFGADQSSFKELSSRVPSVPTVQVEVGGNFSRSIGLNAAISQGVPAAKARFGDSNEDSIICTVDVDFMLPPTMVQTARRNIQARRQVFAPIIFSFFEGKSPETLHAKLLERHLQLREARHLALAGVWHFVRVQVGPGLCRWLHGHQGRHTLGR
jgi:glycosyltransferase involved in cell wall biosynthesis